MVTIEEGTSTPPAGRKTLVRGSGPSPHSSYYGTDACPVCYASLKALVLELKGASKTTRWQAATHISRHKFEMHRDALLKHGMVRLDDKGVYSSTGHYNHPAYWGILWLIENLMRLHPEDAFYGGSGLNMFGGRFPVNDQWVARMRETVHKAVQADNRRFQRRAKRRKTRLTKKELRERERRRLRDYPRILVVDVPMLFAAHLEDDDPLVRSMDPFEEWVRVHERSEDETHITFDLDEARKIASRNPEVGGGRPKRPAEAASVGAPKGTEQALRSTLTPPND